MKTDVTFPSAGLKLAGHLYTPDSEIGGSPGGFCGRQGALESLGGRRRKGKRRDVGIEGLLLVRDHGAAIDDGPRLLCLARRQGGNEGGRVLRISRDVVDRRVRRA